jgi:hypothetical protein
MKKLRAIPGFTIAAAVLFASMLPGPAALFARSSEAVAYLALAQGVIYALFAFLLLRERYALSQQQSRGYFVCLLGLGIAMRAMLLFAPPHSTDVRFCSRLRT